MRLKHMELLNAIMQTGSVTGAAAHLNVSQPAASKMLHLLEGEVKAPLFARVRGRLHPTPEAHDLVKELGLVFRAMDELNAMAASLRDSSSGVLRVASPSALMRGVLPRALRTVSDMVSDLSVEIIDNGQQASEAVACGAVDMAFALHAPPHPAVRSRQLVGTALVHIAPAEGPGGSVSVSPVDVRDPSPLPWIAVSTDDPVGLLTAKSLRRHHEVLPADRTASTAEAAAALVEAGLGQAVVDPLTAQGRAGLVVSPLVPAIPLRILVLLPRARAMGRPGSLLLAHVGREVQALETETPELTPRPGADGR
jgi:DNA-binding transcriptional LysR family regulator